MDTSKKSDDKTLGAWKKFINNEKLNSYEVRDHIYRAWKRSINQGCNPYLLKGEVLSPSKTKELLDRKKDFIDSAHPYLLALSKAAGNERHAAMLADQQANVLEIIGDEQTVHDPTFPGPGTLLSEAYAGANGIGTALAEKDYVELVGAEHFIEGFHCYTCQGLPIYGPDGELEGILSTSVRRIEASERIKEILICAAHGIEAELHRKRLEKDIQNVIANYEKDERPLEELRQDIVQLQSAARIKLETASYMLSNKSKSEKVLDYLKAAEHLVSLFKRRSLLWRSLVSDELSSPGPLNLKTEIDQFLSLLETEALTRKVRTKSEINFDVKIRADSFQFTRRVFRHLLRAFKNADTNGMVTIYFQRSESNKAFLKIESFNHNNESVSIEEIPIELLNGNGGQYGH